MKLHSGTLAALAMTVLLPLGAVAVEPAAPTQTPAAAQAAEQAATAKAKKADKQCDASTATRIRSAKPDECPKSALPTRSYSKADLESTGQTDTAEALRRLDPRFR